MYCKNSSFFSEHICILARIAKMTACLQQQWTHSLQAWLSITLPPKLEEGCPVWSVSFASGILCSLVTSVNFPFFPSKTCSVFCICVQQDFWQQNMCTKYVLYTVHACWCCRENMAVVEHMWLCVQSLNKTKKLHSLYMVIGAVCVCVRTRACACVCVIAVNTCWE